MIILGILEDRSEVCKSQVQDFLKNEMDIDLNMAPEYKIKVAHRIGSKDAKRKTPRAMVAKVNQALKDAIMENIACLEGRQNPQGDYFYINIQQPEAKLEAKRNAKALLKKYQARYKTAKVEMKANKVYVNNEWKRPLIHPPTPQDLFFDSDEQKEMNKLKLIYTQPEDVKMSSFWAAAIRVESPAQVQRVYNKLRQDSPSVDHISAAFVAQHEGEMTSGLADDQEYGAGHRILRVIRERKEESIAVFVVRKFGGEHIGPSRFDIIMRQAQKAIDQLNKFVPPATPTSSKDSTPTSASDKQQTTPKAP